MIHRHRRNILTRSRWPARRPWSELARRLNRPYNVGRLNYCYQLQTPLGRTCQQGHCLFSPRFRRKVLFFSSIETYLRAGQIANSQQIHAPTPAHRTPAANLTASSVKIREPLLYLYRNRQSINTTTSGRVTAVARVRLGSPPFLDNCKCRPSGLKLPVGVEALCRSAFAR